jgi:hypothetical protein
MSQSRARRRALVPSLVAAVAAAGLAAVPAPSQASVPGGSASGWLAPQVDNGLVTSEYTLDDGQTWNSYEDQGLTLDVFYALRSNGAERATRTAILNRLTTPEQVQNYTTGTPGALGKLLTAVELSGRAYDPQLLSDLESSVTASGRANGNGGSDYGVTINQVWVARALANAGSPKTASAVRFLLRQQCAGGGFRGSFNDGGGCAAAAADQAKPDVESTSQAALALIEARAAGVTGLADDIADARTYLVRAQAANGHYTSNDTANSDATGLAAYALRRLGARGAAGNAAGWLLRLQVRGATAQKPALSDDRGAVAYSFAALAEAEKDGITRGATYQWRKATTDGGLGLSSVLPAKGIGVRAPDTARKGARVGVTVRALLGGERFVLRRNGVVVSTGRVPANGVLTRTVTLPRKAGKVVISVEGSRPGRAGASAIRVR